MQQMRSQFHFEEWHRKLNTVLRDHGCGYSDDIFKIVDAAIAAEREACAAIMDRAARDARKYGGSPIAEEGAAAIRARGKV